MQGDDANLLVMLLLYLIVVVYKNEDLEVGVLGDGICFVLQHSDTGVKATWPIT